MSIKIIKPSTALAIGLFGLLASTGLSFAAEQEPVPGAEAAAAPAPAPNVVKLGLYVTQLNDLDMAKRTFDVTFWGWYITPDAAYKPVDTVEVVNAKTTNYKYVSSQVKKDFPWKDGKSDIVWSQAKYLSTMNHNWDMSHYPFDQQDLKVIFEDAVYDNTATLLEADVANSGIDKNIVLPGWNVKSFSIANDDSEYQTNYGDSTASSSSTYSRVVATIKVQRDGFHILTTSFAGFFLSFLLVTITYGMGTSKSGGSRVGVVAAAIFAAIGNKNSIDAALPATPYFTVADAIQVCSFLAIVVAMAMAVLIIWMDDKRPRLLKVTNVVVGIGSISAYIGFIWHMTAAARL